MNPLLVLSLPPVSAIPNTLQKPAAFDINTKSHISLILSDGDVWLTPQKESFWPSVHPLLIIAAKNTSPIKTPDSLNSFHFQTRCSCIQFPAVSWTQLNEPWRPDSSVPISEHGRQFCPLWCGNLKRQLEHRVWWFWRQVSCLEQTWDNMLHWWKKKKTDQMPPKRHHGYSFTLPVLESLLQLLKKELNNLDQSHFNCLSSL